MSKRKYPKEILEPIVAESKSIAGVLRKLELKPAGGNYKTIHYLINIYDLSTSHFTGPLWSKGLNLKEYPEDYLKNEGVKRWLVTKVPYKCVYCGIGSTWNNKKLTLHMDHIDGNSFNNLIENLRLLCPNCHSQTETYCKRKSISSRQEKIAQAKALKEEALRLRPTTLSQVNNTKSNECIDCNISIWPSAVRCKQCDSLRKASLGPSKIVLNKEDLEKMLAELTLTETGELLGCSAQTVKRRAKEFGITWNSKTGPRTS